MRGIPRLQLVFLSALLALCARADIGPLRSPADLSVAEKRLADAGVDLERDIDQTRESLGYIVVSEAIGRDAASELLNQLRSRDIRDVIYVGSGVYEGRVSAGVFRSASTAQQRISGLPEDLRSRFEVAERSRLIEFSAWLRGDTTDVTPALLSELETDLGYLLQRHDAVEPERPRPQPIAPVVTTAVPYAGALPQRPVAPPAQSSAAASSGSPVPIWLVLMFAVFLALVATGLFALQRFGSARRASARAAAELPYQGERPALRETSRAHDGQHPFDQLADMLVTDLPADRGQMMEAISKPGHETLELLQDLIELTANEVREATVFAPDAVIDSAIANAEAAYRGATIRNRTMDLFPVCAGDSLTLARTVASALSFTLAADEESPTDLVAELRSETGMLSITMSNEFGSPARADSLNDMRLTTLSRLLERRGGALTISHPQETGLRLTITLPVQPEDANRLRLATGQTVQDVIDAGDEAAQAASQATERAESLRQTSRHLEQEVDRRKRAEDAAADRVEALEAQLAGAQSRAFEASRQGEEERIEAEANVAALTDQLETAEAQVAEAQTRTREAEARSHSQIETLKVALAEANAQHDRELEEIRRKAAASAEALTALEESLRRSESDLALVRAERESSEARMATEIAGLERRLDASRAEKQGSEEQRRAETESLSQELEDARRRLAELQAQTASLDLKAREVEALGAAKAAAEAAHQAEQAHLQTALTERDQEIDSLRNEINALQTKRNEEATTLDSLKAAVAAAEDKLARQIESNRRANGQTAAEISRLMDELNEAKTAARRATEWSRQVEVLQADLDAARAAANQAESARHQAEARVEELETNRAHETDARDAEFEQLARQLDSVKQKWSSERWARRKLQKRLSSGSYSGTRRAQTDLRDSRLMGTDIAATFNEQLPAQLDSLALGLEQGDGLTVVEKAAWLKSEINAHNQHALEAPLASLEAALRAADKKAAQAAIGEMRQKASNPGAEAVARDAGATERLIFKLPQSPSAAGQMRNFVTLMGTRLLELDQAASDGDLAEVKRIANRLKKYASGFGMSPIVERASLLAEADDSGAAAAMIDDLMRVYSSIELE